MAVKREVSRYRRFKENLTESASAFFQQTQLMAAKKHEGGNE
jgi:hypothetical protein